MTISKRLRCISHARESVAKGEVRDDVRCCLLRRFGKNRRC